MFTSQIAWWLIPVIALSAMLHIQAEYADKRRRVYFFKPFTMMLIILFALMVRPPVDAVYKALILAGLLFSLGGDILLMLPKDRFILGLISFLIGHLFYISAFVSLGGFNVRLMSLVVYVLIGAVMLALLWPGLGKLKAPVIVYLVVILMMGWQAMALWQVDPRAGTFFASVGAALFVISDAVLAFDRFRLSFPAARLVVLSTYFSAQTLIALSLAV